MSKSTDFQDLKNGTLLKRKNGFDHIDQILLILDFDSKEGFWICLADNGHIASWDPWSVDLFYEVWRYEP